MVIMIVIIDYFKIITNMLKFSKIRQKKKFPVLVAQLETGIKVYIIHIQIMYIIYIFLPFVNGGKTDEED